MWLIIKSLFRYSFKNFPSLLMLFVLLFVSSSSFSALIMLSSNLSNSYNTLVKKGNLNNIVINELYSSTYVEDINGVQTELSGEAAVKKNEEEFKKELATLIGADSFRQFKAIDFTNSSSGYVYKIIESDPSYVIDKTVIYEGHDVLKQTFTFDKIIADADWSKDQLVNKRARRLIAFLAAQATWTNEQTDKTFEQDANKILAISDVNSPQYDPKGWNNDLSHFIKQWFDKTDPKYIEPVSKGYRLNLDATKGVIPVVGRIDNLSAYTAVIPDYVLKSQNKQIAPNNIVNEITKLNSIKQVDNEPYNYDYTNAYATQDQIESYIKTIDSKYKIQVDNIDYIITGTGISPSFMYPVYSLERQTPNINNEVLIYTNNSGYHLAFDSARSSPIETYIEAKVADNLLNEYLIKINDLSKKYMSWPENVKSTYSIYDTSNYLSPITLRVSFLPKLVDSQIAISNIIIIFISILTSMIFIFSIKKYINDNRSSLGALRANGVKKRWIVWSMPFLSMFPAMGGGLLGYLFGQFTQPVLLQLYSFYWTIPTPLTIFNPLLFFGLLLIPFVVMSFISIAATYVLLKGNTNKLLNESARFKTTPFSMIASQMFKKANVLTKFRTSIAFSSLPKLVMITIMFSLLGMCTATGVSITNQFNIARTKTFENKDYNFSIDLLSPTIQGGSYFRQQTNFPGRMVLNDKNEVLNYNIGMSDDKYNEIRQQTGDLLLYDKVTQTQANSADRLKSSNNNNIVGQLLLNHDPSFNDSNWQNSDLLYLRNKLQSPATVDSEVGLGSLSTNPWDIVKNLSPVNQITLSNNTTKRLWKTIFNDNNIYFNDANLNGIISNKDIPKMKNKPLREIMLKEWDSQKNVLVDNGFGFICEYYPKNCTDKQPVDTQEPMIPHETSIEIYDEQNNIIKQYIVNKKAINKTFFISSPYVLIMNTLMSLSTRQYNIDTTNMTADKKLQVEQYLTKVNEYKDAFFKIYYQSIPMDDDDETYTTIKAVTDFINQNETLTIKGIKPNSKHIILKNNKNQIVNDRLALDTIKEYEYDNVNKKLHEIYADPRLHDEKNFKVIINESAAYKYNLKVGDTITIDPTEEATRINPWDPTSAQFEKYKQINQAKHKFKIVEIVTTYQNPEFFINQRVANYINGMTEKEILDTSFYNKYDYISVTDEQSWFNYDAKFTVEQIDPYNGFFTRSELPQIINSITLYTTSGLAPATDKFVKNSYYNKLINNVMSSTQKDLTKPTKQNIYISKIQLAYSLGFATVNELDQWYLSVNSDYTKIIDKLINLYGQSPLLSSSVYMEPQMSFYALFGDISTFVDTIFIFVLIIIIMVSVLSVLYLAIDFIYSAISLCGMLKAFGFKDSTNIFSFMSMFFPAIILAMVISIPITIITISSLKSFLFGFSGILLPITYQWWYALIVAGILFLILALTIGLSIYVLRKQKITNLIARY